MRKDKRYRVEFEVDTYEIGMEMIQWCREQFGPKKRGRWGFTDFEEYFSYDMESHYAKASNLFYRYRDSMKIVFYINNKEDAMAFKLRWE